MNSNILIVVVLTILVTILISVIAYKIFELMLEHDKRVYQSKSDSIMLLTLSIKTYCDGKNVDIDINLEDYYNYIADVCLRKKVYLTLHTKKLEIIEKVISMIEDNVYVSHHSYNFDTDKTDLVFMIKIN